MSDIDLSPEALATWADKRAEYHEIEAMNDPSSFINIKRLHGDTARHFRALAALARRPAPDLRTLKDRIDARLNNRLVDMKEGWDDSIVGFNDAWDIVRAAFDEALAAEMEARDADQ